MKNLNILFYILTLPTFFTLTGCGSSDDYWQMENPEIIIMDRGYKHKKFLHPSEFKNESIDAFYGSHLNFKKISDGVTFDIQSICNINGKTITSIFNKQKIYQKLYFYNYVPVSNLLSNNSIHIEDFLCDFKIWAVNKVNSKIEYHLSMLKLNTSIPHKIDIEKGLPIVNFHNSSRYEDNFIDFTDDNSSGIEAELEDKNKVFHKTKILCEDKEFLLEEDPFGSSSFPIEKVFLKTKEPGQLYYRNCRIVSFAKNLVKSEEVDQEKVWSSYFNAILDKPEIIISGELIDFSNNYYTDNNKSFVFDFAKLNIKNLNHIPTFIKFKNTKFNASIKIGYSHYNNHFPYMNTPFYTQFASLNKKGMPSSILKGEISTNLYFDLLDKDDLLNSDLIDLSLGKQYSVVLQAEKNFSCSIFNKRETGIWLQAIKRGSLEDEIEVYVFFKDKIEKFPMPFFLSKLLEKDQNLNLNSNSDYIFDTLLLPKIRSNSFKYSDNYDGIYRNKINEAIKISYSKNAFDYKKRIQGSQPLNRFCKTYPSAEE